LDAAGLKEMTIVLKTVADLGVAAVEPGRVSIEGTAEKMAAAEWLVHQLDRPMGWKPSQQERENPSTREYQGKIPCQYPDPAGDAGNADDLADGPGYAAHFLTIRGCMRLF
jgi:hypothetical protein